MTEKGDGASVAKQKGGWAMGISGKTGQIKVMKALSYVEEGY